MSEVEVVRAARRIKKDYTKLNLSSKYKENDSIIISKRRKCYPANRKNKQNDQSGSQQKQIKDNILQRCLELAGAVPQQVLAFLDKNEKCITPMKLQIQFPSQSDYSASIVSARRVIDLQEETIKDLVGANSNQSLFDFMTKKNKKQPNSVDSAKGQQENCNNERNQSHKSKHMQSSQHTIDHLKQNLQYKINPQFIKSELKKEMLQKEALKHQDYLKTSVLQTSNNNEKSTNQDEGISQEIQIVLETSNKESSSFAGKQLLSPKHTSATTTGISRRNTAPSTPIEPMRQPLRQYSVQPNSMVQYYYPSMQDGEITQFGDQRGGEILSNLGDIKESTYTYGIQDNSSYQPYGTSWSKDSRETTRMVIEEQQFNTHEAYHHLDHSHQIPQIDSQHPQAQAEDILQAIDCQESFSNYHGNHFNNFNHLEVSPVRLSCRRHMIDEQDHFGSDIGSEFD